MAAVVAIIVLGLGLGYTYVYSPEKDLRDPKNSNDSCKYAEKNHVKK